MTVADVACGTGSWLLDAVEQGQSIVGEGLDITLSEVPPKGWLPSNVSFHQFNILEELPKEYTGRYDVINAQFASSFVRDPHIKEVMAALVKMLSKFDISAQSARSRRGLIRHDAHRTRRLPPNHRIRSGKMDLDHRRRR